MGVRQCAVRWRTLGLVILLILPAVPVQAEDAIEARMRKDITYLASDECEGRGVSTRGNQLAGDYIANEFKKAGVKPGGKDGSYFQPFTIAGGTLEGMPHLTLRGPQRQDIVLKQGRDFEPLGLAWSGKVSGAPLVFAGYGVTIEEGEGRDRKTVYDDYDGLDVRGKVVVVLRDRPRANSLMSAPGGPRARFHTLGAKLENADKHGAVGLLLVNNQRLLKGNRSSRGGLTGWTAALMPEPGTYPDTDDLMYFSMTAADGNKVQLPAFHITRAVADQLLENAPGGGLLEHEQDIDRTLKPNGCDLSSWAVSLDLQVRRGIQARNVVGVLEGAGPLADETIVIGAHYDHLGYGGIGSLAALRKPAIHHGADDNGSGTTTVVEVARRFGQMQGRQGRRLVFILFSGEELGLFGSEYYCENPLFPLKDTIAMVNLDMVGRVGMNKDGTRDKLIVYGTGTAKALEEIVDKLDGRNDLKLYKSKDVFTFMSSDQFSFYNKKIPVLFFFTGDHPQYHRPTDTSDLINVPGMARIAGLTQEIVEKLSTTTERPVYVKLPPGPSGGRGDGPRLGIMPKYGDEKEGVLLGGVAAGGAADKAGLKEGDRIIEMAGKPLKNLEAYMTLMAGRKRGDPLEVVILRDGKRMTFTVKPE